MPRTSYRSRKLFSTMPERTKDLTGDKLNQGWQNRAQDAAIPSDIPNPRPLTVDDIKRELSVRGTLIYDRALFYPYNPDDLSSVRPQASYPMQGLWAKHGPFAVYRRMRTDEQVKGCLTFKKLARLSHGFQITPFDKTPLASEIADFIKYNFDKMEGSFHTAMKEILSALDFGFSISEKNYRICDSGKFVGKIVLKDIKTRAPETFRFNNDEYGNIRNLTQFLPNATPIELPTDKFIIYTYAMEFQNHYGQSDLRAAYRSWWSKDFVIKAWNIFLDRYGMPTRVMTLPPSAEGDQAIVNKAMSILDSIQTDTSITLPPGFEVDFKTIGQGGNATYQEALDRYDRAIAKALLYPELGGLTERQSGGSQHMANSQMSGYDLVLMDLGLDLEELVVAEQIIKPLVHMNYGDQVPIPIFKLGAMTLRDAGAFIEQLTKAAQSNLITWGYSEETSVRKTLDLPEISEDDWKTAHEVEGDYVKVTSPNAPPASIAGDPNNPNPENPNPDGGGGFPLDKGGGEPPKPPPPPDPNTDKAKKIARPDGKNFHAFEDVREKLIPKLLKAKHDWDHIPKGKKKKFAGKVVDREKTKFEQRINFSQLEKDMDSLESVGTTAFVKLMAEAGQKADAFVKTKKLLEDPSRQTEILDFDFPVTPFQRLFETIMLAQYLWGKWTVVNELRKDGKPIPEKFGTIDDANNLDDFFDGYDPKDTNIDKAKLIDFFSVKGSKSGKMAVPFKTGELARVKDKFKVKAHAIAGVNKTKVLSNVQQMLQKAVDEGWSYETWKDNLDDSMGNVAGTVFGNYGEGDPDEATHAQTTFRTILNETFNDGRLESMKDDSLGVTVVGVQFSAIMDQATTQICRDADQLYMKLGNPNLVTPPFHFNCRTIIIEVLDGEDDDIEWADELPTPPASGFGKHDFCDHAHHFEMETTGVNPHEPVVIYTHREDMDGLLSGILAQRLAYAKYGKVIPVAGLTYDDIRLVDPKNTAWFCDLSLDGTKLSENVYNTFFDHHNWKNPPAGTGFIEKDNEKSAAGVVATVLNAEDHKMMDGLFELVLTVQAGDLHKIDDVRYETARDLQYLLEQVGFEAMWNSFADHPEKMLESPMLPAMRERRDLEDEEGFLQAKESLIKTVWGGIVQFKIGDWTDILNRISTEVLDNKTCAYISKVADGFEVRFISENGSAIKIATKLGGGGHPDASGAILNVVGYDDVVKFLQNTTI